MTQCPHGRSTQHGANFAGLPLLCLTHRPLEPGCHRHQPAVNCHRTNSESASQRHARRWQQVSHTHVPVSMSACRQQHSLARSGWRHKAVTPPSFGLLLTSANPNPRTQEEDTQGRLQQQQQQLGTGAPSCGSSSSSRLLVVAAATAIQQQVSKGQQLQVPCCSQAADQQLPAAWIGNQQQEEQVTKERREGSAGREA